MKLGTFQLPKWPVAAFLPICKPMKPTTGLVEAPIEQHEEQSYDLLPLYKVVVVCCSLWT